MDILDREDVQAVWKQVTDPTELRKFSVRVLGGSTTKPTSGARKEEALKLAQALGQFAQAAPMIVTTMLKILEDAFDNIELSDEEWAKLVDSITQMQQNSVGGTPAAGGQPQAGGDQGQPAEGGGELPPELQAQVEQLPPEAQKAILLAIQQGVPPEKAVLGVMERLSGGGGEPQ